MDSQSLLPGYCKTVIIVKANVDSLEGQKALQRGDWMHWSIGQ